MSVNLNWRCKAIVSEELAQLRSIDDNCLRGGSTLNSNQLGTIPKNLFYKQYFTFYVLQCITLTGVEFLLWRLFTTFINYFLVCLVEILCLLICQYVILSLSFVSFLFLRVCSLFLFVCLSNVVFQSSWTKSSDGQRTVQMPSHQTAYIFELSSHLKTYINHTLLYFITALLTCGHLTHSHGDFGSQSPCLIGSAQ